MHVPADDESHGTVYRMLQILDRYFLRELATSVVATLIVLLVIVTGGTFAHVLQQVAGGSFPASVMFEVLGLNVLATLSAVLPLAVFVGVLVALGRLWRDSEMHVLASSGMGRRGLLRPALYLAVPMALLAGVVSLWLGPWSVRTSHAAIADANKSVIAAGLEAGRFTELPGKGGIIFVDSMNHAGTRLGKVLIAREQPATGTHPARLDVVTATHGKLYQEDKGGMRFLGLFDGWRFQIPLGQPAWRRMKYRRQDVALSSVEPGEDSESGNPLSEVTTATLFGQPGADARAELAWRITSPITVLVLVLLALPLARQSPREPRYGRLLIAVLGYFLYVGLVSLCRVMIAQGKLPDATVLWVLQTLVAAGAWWFLRRQYRPWKKAEARA